ncbi:MerR family transcriptional regulator [Sciscionella sediminilitoris]|uniref:MerR family transcriptional regulator n=1 Tax=Sciscionella sediminilitoris TaxID=1445613 RepID=UPI0004DF44E0|nr:MerR family transcriptional regulator [Sciscionella sp. SE31]
MAVNAGETEQYLGIAEVAERTGLTQNTLRWYEREGMFPRVLRGTDRRRRYTERQVGLLRLLTRLRRTGMPTREMRRFSELLADGATTHGQRLELLTAHRERILARQAELRADLEALDDKVAHYHWLIEQGLDCSGAPINAETDTDNGGQ